jgi:predicted DsbA family dithiol-disulfide isomerase
VARLGAAALLAEPLGREPGWRERAFTAVFEEGVLEAGPETVRRLAREIELPLEADALDAALDRLRERTEGAREEEVSGVPTFMLGSWPFGGIQSDDTMLRVLERFASRQREAGSAELRPPRRSGA